jgi:hypothetical protein
MMFRVMIACLLLKSQNSDGKVKSAGCKARGTGASGDNPEACGEHDSASQ